MKPIMRDKEAIERLSDFSLDNLLKRSYDPALFESLQEWEEFQGIAKAEMERRLVLSGRDEPDHKEAMDDVRRMGEFKEGIWIRCMEGDEIVGMFETISSKYVKL